MTRIKLLDFETTWNFEKKSRLRVIRLGIFIFQVFNVKEIGLSNSTVTEHVSTRECSKHLLQSRYFSVVEIVIIIGVSFHV